MNSFSDWCNKNNVHTKDSSKCTHLLLNGGKLEITADNVDGFCEAYVSALKSNEKLYVVEKISKQINLFIDIDNKKELLDVSELVQRIQETLPIHNIVYKCNKTNGIHIVYPGRTMSPDEALSFVKAPQRKLVHSYKYKLEDIENVLDTSVYKTGLRMIGSFKVNDFRSYLPNEVTSRRKITVDMVRESFIRASFENKEKTQETKMTHGGEINIRDKLSNEISRLNENYKNIKITSIKKIDNSFCIGTDSHFCMNKGDVHTNHVYFIVTDKKKIYQKCFSHKNVQHKNGECSKFKSKGEPFGQIAYGNLLKNFQ